MKRTAIYIIGMVWAALTMLPGCNVHEWPQEAEAVPFDVQLNFNIEMTMWDHFYNRSRSRAKTETYDKRYVIKAYPIFPDGTVSSEFTREFTFTKPNVEIGDDYSFQARLDLPEGKYRLMVWTDFVEPGSTAHTFYNCDKFNSIVLHGSHKANTDYRDGFAGTVDVTLESTIQEGVEIVKANILLKRPFAKYTFVSNDLQEFISRELLRLSRNDNGMEDVEGSRVINLEDYKVVIYYPMYMPNTYNLFTDKAVNSATGVQYVSKPVRISQDEVVLGFDYVVINDNPDAKVTVAVGVFDKEGTQIAMSESFNIPLKRSVNTIVRGKFMTVESDGGISIDPSFNGDHNIVLP